jgi:SAM-dependent methyltransferase
MDVVTRAFLDLRSLDVSNSEAEARYRDFRDRSYSLLSNALGGKAQTESFLEQYFLSFLPAVLSAATAQDQLDKIECDEERALIDEVMADKQGLLAHSPVYYPLNRMCMSQVTHRRPALDLGVGNGRSSNYILAGRTLDVGADIIPSNLVKARTRKSHNEYYVLDIAALPFERESFQTVYALNCIYHVQGGRGKALNEMVRVLAPGGTLALTDVSPYLNEFKPLESFFHNLGFETLAGDFTKYFLSGYGADGSPGEPDWYAKRLAELGMVDVKIEYLMSPRLSRLAYLLYDWQALFNFDLYGRLDSEAGEQKYLKNLRPMLMSLIAPLLRLDSQHCKESGKGGYVFVTARRPGPAESMADRQVVCPVDGMKLSTDYHCSSCGRTYPVAKGIPLLTKFFADGVG